MSEIIEKMNLQWAQEDAYSHCLDSGVVSSRFNDQRYFYLTSQLLESYYEVLKYELGDAWKDVMHSCGYRWGLSLHAKLISEMKQVGDFDFEQLTVSEYFEYVNSFFKTNGIGTIQFVDDYITDGIIFASVKNSIVQNALRKTDGKEDCMLAGLLEGLFEKISGSDLGCVQLKNSDEKSTIALFVITGKERMEGRQDSIKKVSEITEAVAALNAIQ